MFPVLGIVNAALGRLGALLKRRFVLAARTKPSNSSITRTYRLPTNAKISPLVAEKKEVKYFG